MASDPQGSWDRVDELFEMALDLPEEQREVFLQEACADSPQLLPRLRRLLKAESRVGSFLEEPSPALPWEVLEGISRGAPGPLEAMEGQTVDRYRILGVLGQGGMSTVYRAERADGVYQQEVALKVLRGDPAPEDLASRLESERQILASLSHPNICRILDGGVTDDGRPFLVMDLVEGLPIHDFADRRNLSVEERLRLFLQVTRAVQYAHQNLIVHRDLKPSNILVDQRGHVVLLDFGIAKLLDPQGAAGEAQTRVMTPEYAAPEQILGRTVTTATDVHALGVILNELLTGVRPFGDQTTSGYEVAKAICETEPRPPSSLIASAIQDPSPARRTSPTRLRRTLAGDLDAVVLKALRKDPEDRYPSAEAFARDMESFLQGRPVEAREGATFYRAKKFVLRHRLAMGMAAIMALLVITGGTALIRSQSLAAMERDRAQQAAQEARREAENAQAAVGFLADVFKGGNPTQSPGDTLTALELLEWGDQRARAEFENNPVLKAEIMTVMGQAYDNLGFPERGQILLEESLETIREVHGPGSRETVSNLLALGQNLRAQRATQDAVPLYNEALRILEETRDTLSNTFAEALFGLGMSFRDAGNPDSASVLLARVADLRKTLNGEGSLKHVQAELSLASALRAMGDYTAAEELYRRSVPRIRVLSPPDDPTLPVHLNNFAFLLVQREEFQEAAGLYREALRTVSLIFGRGHPNALSVGSNLASALARAGNTAQADSVLADNVQAARSQWPQGHWRVGRALNVLGIARLQAGKLDAAETPLAEAAKLYRATLGREHFWTLMAQGYLDMLRLRRDRAPEARAGLDSLRRRLGIWQEEGQGSLLPETVLQLEPFVRTLDAVGLAQDADRFREFLPSEAS